ncbi:MULTISPECIES: hypothetical protein [unclassified Bradyrhizobium]|uniref:hypothetical protein n=1 Tax=unclassified Bradyrhizobium TaxID=2631580 RepID=UPI0024785465|nr:MULTISPECIES: hypothetical protein [unclassified Bradyrhizobium]WGR70240.1 hypothetical protein MTX24_33375 [Bradyrhizobium sp. ISRA426]WGR82299.1 hypothetical protein MTX21_18480 [Bradyrhizobium sp. ISRA430]WGR85484.1 hypothetical protein MTX25_33055 [Bradyrhizobium sp. ISRA432]
MRSLAVITALLLSCGLGSASAEEMGRTNQAQMVPVQPDQTPQQAEHSRTEERARGEEVQIGRDWKAQDNDTNRAGSVDKMDENHQTVGRDWRAHPDDKR